MASEILINDQHLSVANRRLSTLIAFALVVAADDASTAEEEDYVAKLKDWDGTEHWPGCSFDLHKRFPTVDEKKFWSRCFFNVGHRVFRREIGNQDIQSWQCGVICDAYLVARMLMSESEEH